MEIFKSLQWLKYLKVFNDGNIWKSYMMEIFKRLQWWKYLKVLYYFGYIWYKLSTDIILDISIEYLGIEHVFIDIWYKCAITIYWFCFVYMF